MPISFVGASQTSEAEADGQLACTKPAGTTEGDVMIVWQHGSRHTHSAPAGWTQFEQRTASTNQQLTGWYKVAGPSEPSTYNFNNGASSQIMQVHICTYRGVDPAAPIGPTNGATSTSAEALATGSVTGTANCWIISASGDYDSSATVSTCTTSDGSDAERADTGHGVSAFLNNRMRSCACYDSNRALGAVSHSRTLTVTGSTSAHSVIIAVLNELTVQDVAPTGRASTATVGSPAFTRGPVSVAPSGRASTSVVGSPRVGLGVRPSGIASTAAFGTLTFGVLPEGIPSTISVGNPSIQYVIGPSGISSTIQTGSADLAIRVRGSLDVRVLDFHPPRAVQATPVNAARIDLEWEVVWAATGYDIERDGEIIARDVPGTKYSDTGLIGGTTYTYRVRAVRAY